MCEKDFSNGNGLLANPHYHGPPMSPFIMFPHTPMEFPRLANGSPPHYPGGGEFPIFSYPAPMVKRSGPENIPPRFSINSPQFMFSGSPCRFFEPPPAFPMQPCGCQIRQLDDTCSPPIRQFAMLQMSPPGFSESFESNASSQGTLLIFRVMIKYTSMLTVIKNVLGYKDHGIHPPPRTTHGMIHCLRQ